MRIVKIIQPVLIVFVVHIIFTYFLLQYYRGDLSCLVHAGETFTNSAETPVGLCLQDSGDGYDGQFNYRFTLDPFSNAPVSHGISIDRPIYRYQRILFPFLVWILTWGNEKAIPVVFVLLNLIFACLLTAISAIYALDQGRNSHWSLAIGLYLGFLFSYALNLGHTLEIFLLFAAIFFIKKNDLLAVLLLVCAILTRETALLFTLAVLIVAFIQHWRKWYLYLFPLLVFFAWQVFLRWFWKGVPDLTSGENLSIPLAGFLRAISSSWQRGDSFGVFLLCCTTVFGLFVLLSIKSSSASNYLKLAWLLYSAMALMMSFDVWAKFNGYLRGLSEWYFLGCLIIFPLIKLHSWRGMRNNRPFIRRILGHPK